MKEYTETKLSRAIEESGIRYNRIAEKIGVNKQCVTNYANYGVLPNVKVAIKIAKVLGYTVEELFGEDEPNEHVQTDMARIINSLRQ